MDDKILKYLEDILSAIVEIDEEVDTRGRRFDILCSDRVFRRFITIICEAMNQVLKLSPDIAITSARRIVNTRNLFIHSYDSVDNEVLWSIVINHIPLLKTEVDQLIKPFQ